MSEFFEVLKFARDSTRKWTQVISTSERYSQTTAFFECQKKNFWKWFSFRLWPLLKSVEESEKKRIKWIKTVKRLKLHNKPPGLTRLRAEWVNKLITRRDIAVVERSKWSDLRKDFQKFKCENKRHVFWSYVWRILSIFIRPSRAKPPILPIRPSELDLRWSLRHPQIPQNDLKRIMEIHFKGRWKLYRNCQFWYQV